MIRRFARSNKPSINRLQISVQGQTRTLISSLLSKLKLLKNNLSIVLLTNVCNISEGHAILLRHNSGILGQRSCFTSAPPPCPRPPPDSNLAPFSITGIFPEAWRGRGVITAVSGWLLLSTSLLHHTPRAVYSCVINKIVSSREAQT